MNDATRRSLRTLLQVGTVEAFLRVLEAFGVPITEDQHAALLVFLTPVLSFLLNWAEDNTRMPALLKAAPSPGVNPVPPDRPAT